MDGARLRRQVQEHGCQLCCRNPVGHRVVELLDQRDTAVLQAIDECELPQWSVAGKRYSQELAAEGEQLRLTTRAPEPAEDHVVGDVKARVIRPDQRCLVKDGSLRELTKLGNQ